MGHHRQRRRGLLPRAGLGTLMWRFGEQLRRYFGQHRPGRDQLFQGTWIDDHGIHQRLILRLRVRQHQQRQSL
jgi:hypothetical protein